MSYDLGVWYSDKRLTNEEAGRIYVQLCEHWPFLEGQSPTVAAFYDELTRRWPEIDTVPDDRIDDTDYCPWSCALNHSGMAVVIPCVWSKAHDVAAFVHGLAQKHGLVLYDPQAGTVHLPQRLKR